MTIEDTARGQSVQFFNKIVQILDQITFFGY